MMDIAQTAPETIILAEDEASLYLQATTTTVWAPCGQTPVVSVQPARDRESFDDTRANDELRSDRTTLESSVGYLS
jgi:hypothetical protein